MGTSLDVLVNGWSSEITYHIYSNREHHALKHTGIVDTSDELFIHAFFPVLLLGSGTFLFRVFGIWEHKEV